MSNKQLNEDNSKNLLLFNSSLPFKYHPKMETLPLNKPTTMISQPNKDISINNINTINTNTNMTSNMNTNTNNSSNQLQIPKGFLKANNRDDSRTKKDPLPLLNQLQFSETLSTLINPHLNLNLKHKNPNQNNSPNLNNNNDTRTFFSEISNQAKDSLFPISNNSNSNNNNCFSSGSFVNKMLFGSLLMEKRDSVKPIHKWDKAKVEFVWNKLRLVKNKVMKKKDSEYELLKYKVLQNKTEEVYRMLIDTEFIKFYRNKDNLFPEDLLMDIMVTNNKFDLLLQLLNTPYYKYNNDYIFTYVFNMLNSNNQIGGDQSDIESSNAAASMKYTHLSNTDSKLLLLNCDIKNKTSIFDGIIENDLYNYKDEKRTKIIGWLLGFLNYYDTFLLLISKNTSYYSDFEKYNKFNSTYDIKHYCESPIVITSIIEYCIKCNFEELAIVLLEYTKVEAETNSLVTCAAELERMEFLRILWEKDYYVDNCMGNDLNKREKSDNNISNNDNHYSLPLNYPQRHQHQYIGSATPFNVSNVNNNFSLYKSKVSFETIIKILIKNKMSNGSKSKDKYGYSCKSNINKILTWRGIENDPTFINTLFDNDCFEQISYLIYQWPSDRFADINYFTRVIEKEQTELIIYFLRKRKECKSILNEEKIQGIIVEKYSKYGDKLYYAAEMLMYIHKNQWMTDLTKNLCKNIIKTIKTKDISNCHSIILTCLLLCEFLTQIKEISIANVSRCEKVMNELKEYCKNIQESNPQESYIGYLMKQKDTKDRSAFQIASDNNVYCLLETAEVGTIVKKMWDGKLSNNGFFAASSLHRYLDNDRKVTEPFLSFDNLDTNKVYFFQFCVWTDSCSLRYKPEGLGTIILIIIYNVLIYLIALRNQMLNNFYELDPELQLLLVIYIIWVTTLMFGMIIQIIFLVKTKRKFKLDVWNYIDILLFLFAWLILVDTRQMHFSSHDNEIGDVLKNVLWDLEIPFTKELGTEVNEYSNSFSFIFKSIILAINDILVWMRITGILLTYKEMGPVIRMIMKMAFLLVKYLLIIALFLACCASIFTAIFNRYSHQFNSFSQSILTLFGGFLNTFDTNDFDPDYQVLGSIMLMAYVCIAGVLLVNLLIAVLSNVYEELAKVVDASHRAVLIQYYHKSKWDKNYGYLIFLTPPLSIVNYITLVISCCITNKNLAQFNEIVSKTYYFIFYYPLSLLSYMLYTIILIPFCYIKGIILMIKYQSGLKILFIYKMLHVFKWVFGGIFYLFFVFFRDILFSLRNVFRNFEAKDSDLQRISKNLTERDVIIFLKFIHSRYLSIKSKNIHSLFLAYLDFEAEEASKDDGQMKKKKEYIQKLNMSLGGSSKRLKLDSLRPNKAKTFFLYKANETSKLYTKYIRKNLMIIEILENFLFEDEYGISVVDIDKMRKLLPMSMNISKPYLRRLMHSDAHALNQAMTKLKVSKNLFLQYQLINKIMCSAQRLDKEIDSEIIKMQRLKANEKKYEKAIGGENDGNGDDNAKNVQQKKQELRLMKKYDKVIKNVLSTISETITNKNDNNYGNVSEKGCNADNGTKKSMISQGSE